MILWYNDWPNAEGNELKKNHYFQRSLPWPLQSLVLKQYPHQLSTNTRPHSLGLCPQRAIFTRTQLQQITHFHTNSGAHIRRTLPIFMPSLEQVPSKGSHGRQAIEGQGLLSQSYLRMGGRRSGVSDEGRRAGSFLLASLDVPGSQLISSRRRELLQVVQLLLNFELRDCCGCCTFGDLPSLSLEESIWKQEKKKKKKGRGREGDSIVFCTYLQTC